VTEFKTSIKKQSECGFCPKDSEWSLEIPFEMDQKISSMSFAMGSTEWLGYFDVDKDEKEKVFIMKDLRVPKQEVGAASVKVTESEAAFGSIHSHHTMGAFHSGTDEDSVGGNHNLVVVYSTNNGGSYVAKQRVILPCKGYRLQELDVYVIDPNLPEVDDWVKEAKKNIHEIVYAGYQGGVYVDGSWEAGWVEEKPGVWIRKQDAGSNVTPEVCVHCKQIIPSFAGVRNWEGKWKHPGCFGSAATTPLSTPVQSPLPEARKVFCGACHCAVKPEFVKMGKDGIAYHYGCCPDPIQP